jgi:hypothetical protein
MKRLTIFFYLIGIVLILSYAGLIYVNNSSDEVKKVSREYYDSGKLKKEVQVKTKSEPNTLSNVDEESTSAHRDGTEKTLVKVWSGRQKVHYCSDSDRQLAKQNGYQNPDHAYKFGNKIIKLIREKDLSGLYSLIDELDYGPQKFFIRGKEFSDVFSDEWRNEFLTTTSQCTPLGWRGYLLGKEGHVRYNFRDDKWRITSIYDSIKKDPKIFKKPIEICNDFNKNNIEIKKIIFDKKVISLTINDKFELAFEPDSTNELTFNIWFKYLSSSKRTLIANIEPPDQSCRGYGCYEGPYSKINLSDDGSTVGFNALGKTIVYEIESRNKLFDSIYTSFALSPEGDRLVIANYDSGKFGWSLSMYRLNQKTKEILSGQAWDITNEFDESKTFEEIDYKVIHSQEDWYKGQEFIFTKNGENLILAKSIKKVDAYDDVYNLKTKKLSSCAGSDH